MASIGSRRATVHVKLPELISAPEKRARKIVEATRAAVERTMVLTLKDIRTGDTVPVNTGALHKSLRHTRATQTRDGVSSQIISAGMPAIYAPVMDQGRTPGRRMWFGWLYYGRDGEGNPASWKSGWVWRRMKNEVRRIAHDLQSKYKAAHPRKRSGVSRRFVKFEQQAAYLLARKIARNIAARGIKARRFASRYSKPGPAREKLLKTLGQSMSAEWKRRGLTG